MAAEWLTGNMKLGNRTLSSWNCAIDVNIIEHSSIDMSIDVGASNGMDNLTIAIETNTKTRIDVQIAFDDVSSDATGNGVIYAACLLVFLNVLIISEVINEREGNP